jgi:DNA-binding transcriptional ArsR family regulator|tara:strand:- start:718 stop:1044 length:327 start_codon:yes stop_codon:yes gene_type:complete
MPHTFDTRDLLELQKHAAEAAELMKQLSNPNRLMILCALIGAELSVGQLNAMTDLSQSALSQHLALLRNAHLVTTRRVAQTIYYRLSGDAAIQIITVLKSIYCPDRED